MTIRKLIEMSLESDARDFAEKAHEGQKRKLSKEPYSNHPKRVAEIVKNHKKSKEIESLAAAAHLHDTLEDTPTTYDELEKKFGKLVASLVKELSSDKIQIKLMGKAHYLANKMKGMTSWALVIKLADRLDNVSDLATATPEFRDRYKQETIDIIREIERDRTLSHTQRVITQQIKDKLKEL